MIKTIVTNISVFKNKLNSIVLFSLILFIQSCGETDPTLNNSQGAIDPALNYSIEGTTLITADGVAESIVTIILKNHNGVAVVGTVPEIEATDTDNTNIYSACSATDTEGKSTCKITSTKAESKVLKLISPLKKSAKEQVVFIAGPETTIVILTQPTASLMVGQVFPESPKVVIVDAKGNPTIASSSTMSIAAFSDASCDSAAAGEFTTGLNPVGPDGATATYEFNNNKYKSPGTIYLEFTASSGIPSVCSDAVFLSGGLNYHLEFLAGPSLIAQAGENFTIQPSLSIKDQFNVIASDPGAHDATITLAAFSNSGCTAAPLGVLGGAKAVNANLGVASTFAANYNEVETIYLKATSPGMISACSTGINVAVGPASALTSTIIGTGPVAANNYHFSTVTLTLKDQFGHLISGGLAPTFKAKNAAAENGNNYGGCSIPNALGVSTCELRSSVAEIKTLEIATPIVKANGTITFIPPPDSANTTIAGTVVTADGTDPSIITINLKDASNNPVVGLKPTFDGTNTGSTNFYGTCSTSNAAGVSTCGMTSTTAEVKTLHIIMPLAMTGQTATFVAGSPVAANSSITGTTPIVADGSAAATITIVLKDIYNNLVSGITPDFTATDTNTVNTKVACGATNASGQSTCQLKSTYAESKALSITSPFTKAGDSVVFIPGAKAKLLYITQPSSVAGAGVDIAQQPTVEVRDVFDNLISDSTDTITLSPYLDSLCNTTLDDGTLNNNTAVVNGTNGQATFANLNYEKVAFIYFKATSGAATGCSAVVNVTAGLPAQVAFSVQPSNTISMIAIAASIEVEIQDQFGNIVQTATDNVTLVIGTDPSGATASLAGTITKAAVSGVATFDDISIDRAFTGYDLIASSAALITDTSSSFDIIIGTPDHVSFTIEPTNTVAGVNISAAIKVEIRDLGDNLVVISTDNVTLSFDTDPSTGAATIAGTLTQAAVAGVATFNDINIDKAYAGYDLQATATGLTAASSASFNISPDVAHHLTTVIQPSDAISSVNIAPSITIDIKDQFDNVVNSADNIVLAFGNDPSAGSATLDGTLTKAAVAGTATFSDINIDIIGVGYTLLSTSGILISSTSNAFNISPAVADHLVFQIEPSHTVAGENITASIKVDIVDISGNITTNTDDITLSINSDPSSGTATLSGTLTIAAIAGTATFSDISIDQAFTAYDLKATALGATQAISTAFDITAAALNQLSFITGPSSTSPVDTTFSQQPVIEARDQFNNIVLSSTDPITLTAYLDSLCLTTPAAGILGATLNPLNLNGVDGQAAFSGVQYDTSEQIYLQANFGAIQTCSAMIDVTSPVASQVVFTDGPSHTVAGVNISPAIKAEIRDAANNLITSYTDNVTLALSTDPSSGAATLSGTLTVAAVGGIATFSDISINKAFTGYSLVISSGVLATDISSTFNISPDVKQSLSFFGEPADGLLNSNISPDIEIEIVDQYGNRTNDTDTILIALNNDPTAGAVTLSGTLSIAAVNGKASFSDIQMDMKGTSYTLDATAAGLTLASSAGFNITGAPTKLAFATNPSDSLSNSTITPSFTVEIQDDEGDLVSSASATISIVFQNDPSSGTAIISGSLSNGTINGVATFSNISVDAEYADYTLIASGGGYTAGISWPFDIIPVAPDSLTLISPISSPDIDSTPTIQVGTVSSGDLVKLFTNSDCSTQVASFIASGTTVDLTTTSLPEGVNNLYANRSTPQGSVSSCSSATLAYTVSGSFDQMDIMTALGNWSNVGGDNGDWSINSGDTASAGVGPTTGSGGAGSYAYTEASSPVAVNDVFYLESNVLDGATYDLAFEFDWNKRGDNMGDLFLEASTDGGSSWGQIWSHTGVDVATDGVNIWNHQTVDICDLGYNTANVMLRFKGVMPASGNVWNSDIAIDQLHVNTGGCQAIPPATVDISNPAAETVISAISESSFTVGGACSDNGQSIILSGSVSGSTTCSANSWSKTLDLSSYPDGAITFIVDHLSAAGGASGTANRIIQKDSILIQIDNLDTIGNWSNVAGDDGDFTINTGDTPSTGVGPTSDQSGSGGYAYVEASSPVAADDVFYLDSNNLSVGSWKIQFAFDWNKRGDTMADLYVDVSADNGLTWTNQWSHVGVDVAKSGVDIWNSETVDLCSLGFNSGTLKVRVRAVMPSSGTIWNSDVAVDNLKFSNDSSCP